MKMSGRGDRVCILGTPRSGKSMYLVALYYLLTKDPHFSSFKVEFPRSDNSKKYYEDQLTFLRNRGSLQKTPGGELFDADMVVTHHKRDEIVFRVSTKDVSGDQLRDLFKNNYDKLVKYLEGENVSLRIGDRLILDLMKSSNNFILFWDPEIRADGYDQALFLKNIVRTLEEIHQEDWSQLAIALLITKADAFPHVRKCYPYLFKHSGDLITKIKAYLDKRFAIYPVSSLGGFRWVPGGQGKGVMASRGQLAPRNVLEPLLWFQDVTAQKQVFVRGQQDATGPKYLTPLEHDSWFDKGFDDIFGGL